MKQMKERLSLTDKYTRLRDKYMCDAAIRIADDSEERRKSGASFMSDIQMATQNTDMEKAIEALEKARVKHCRHSYLFIGSAGRRATWQCCMCSKTRTMEDVRSNMNEKEFDAYIMENNAVDGENIEEVRHTLGILEAKMKEGAVLTSSEHEQYTDLISQLPYEEREKKRIIYGVYREAACDIERRSDKWQKAREEAKEGIY